MTYITTAKKTTNVLTAKETMALVLVIVRHGRKKKITKLKHTQNITYPEARTMVETTKYAEVTKKHPNNQKTKLLYVWNKHNHKTWGGCPACKWNEIADPGDGNHHRSGYWKTLQRPKHQSCNKPRETGKAWQPSLPRWLLSLDHYRPHPKRKLKGMMGKDMVQNRKKIQLKNKNYPKKGQIWAHGNEGFHFCQTGKIQMNTQMKNEKPGSTFKMPSRTKSPIWIKHCNTQGSTKPLRKTYNIESMDSDTDHVVTSLNLEEVLNNFNTWNYSTVGQLISSLTFLNVNLLHIIHIHLSVCKQMTDVKLLLLHSNSRNHLAVCEQVRSK